MATILIVDDVSDNRQFLVTVLRYHGHRLLEAADGREGLAAAQAHHPDMVITDVLMPVMDGYELARQLRLDPATSAIPVVFYTANYGEREARALAQSSGVPEVLPKPTAPDEVLRIVARVLSGPSAWAVPATPAPLATDFDREHLRLLPDRLPETTADLRAANARLRAVINIGLELASERDADQLLQRVCLAARDLFAATYVTLGVLDLSDRTVQRVVTCGTEDTSWIKRGDRVPGILGTVVDERRTVRGENPGGIPANLRLPVLHPDIDAFVAAPIASAARVHGWICLVGNEGRTFTADDEQLVLALAGQLGRFYELEREILDRHQAESALRTLEEQYQQAQKMEAIGRLAGGVAHDFNNLLTVILGHCDLLLDNLAADDVRREDLAEIRKAGASGASLTRQLLAVSRKQVIKPTLIDLNEVATDTRAMLDRLIEEDVRIVMALKPGLARVLADRGQVEQIVMNLAVNARDAMPGGGTLTIETGGVELDETYASTHLGVKPGPYVALIVTDTGTGLTPEVRARLFEPFFTTKDLGKGTGLGLATVHGIVMRCGGSIVVDSEVGKGASFKVYFPQADAAAMAGDVPLPAALPRTPAETVLVVDDAEGSRDITTKLLERQGYRVLVAANADYAAQLFAQDRTIDVLLTDVVMPGASGPELIRRLVEQRPALKVVYMSGYPEDAILQHGVLDPGIAFLPKPFTAETLGRKIREVIDR
jgi:signal transduction histidine kinase/DNA-binding response OmpR family regulator